MKKPQVVSATGWAYFPIAFAARFPYAMLVVGVLTLVVSQRESVALGGLNSAAVGIGTALCGPLLGYAADRFGQRLTLLAASVLTSAAIIILVCVVTSTLPDWAVLVSAFAVGATAPQVAPMSRTRLVHAVTRKYSPSQSFRVLNTVMAYESAVDEVAFVFGPVAVGVLAVAFSPVVAVVSAALLTLVFVAAFALHHTARTGGEQNESHERVSVRGVFTPGIAVAALGTLGIGLVFGSTLTSLTAFLDTTGSADLAGVIYGCLGVGSTILALSVSVFPDSFALAQRWLCFGGVMVVAAFAFSATGTVTLLCVTLVLIGVGIGPTLVTVYSIGSKRAPAGATATALTILGSGVVLGQSLASAFTGSVAENFGAETAMLIPGFSALVVLIAAIWNSRMPETSGVSETEREAVGEVVGEVVGEAGEVVGEAVGEADEAHASARADVLS